MRAWTLSIAISSSLFGCFGDPDPNPDPPNPPSQNDPAFSIAGLRSWYLIGDAARPGNDRMTFIVTAPSGADYVDAYIPTIGAKRMQHQSDGYALDLSIAGLAPGDYDILFSANNSNEAFAKATFHRSAAYYVLVSTDYDFSDPGAVSLTRMDALHTNHPGVVITHFWAPYTYTDPAVTDARRDELDTWIKKQRDVNHDEIGLHIHPYCNFVDTAGIACITDQSTVYATDTSGYTIKLAAYGRTQMGMLLQRAKDIFATRGLGEPKTFRAGGWTADENVLLALDDNGFVADTSALNWAKIEEWNGKELYTWNMEHWSSITDTSQPYYPSTTDPQTSVAGSNMAMLEVPDNGVMIDYVSLAEMTGIFDANWTGNALLAPTTLMMGFHPADGFTSSEYLRVDEFLKYADMHLATKDLGPVVYISLSDVTPVFPAQ